MHFRLTRLRCHIQYKDGRKLCNVTVPKVIERLGKPFSIEVPKQDRLDWRGNEIVFEIKYKYDKEAKSATIKIPYKLVGGGSSFPMWLLWVILLPVLGVIVFLLIRHFIPPPLRHHITLTQVSEAGTPLGEKAYFTLENDTTLEFGPEGPEELRFDVGSNAYIHCVKKNLMLFANADDEEGHILDLPEILTLNLGEGDDEVYVRCEIMDDTDIEPVEDNESYYCI